MVLGPWLWFYNCNCDCGEYLDALLHCQECFLVYKYSQVGFHLTPGQVGSRCFYFRSLALLATRHILRAMFGLSVVYISRWRYAYGNWRPDVTQVEATKVKFGLARAQIRALILYLNLFSGKNAPGLRHNVHHRFGITRLSNVSDGGNLCTYVYQVNTKLPAKLIHFNQSLDFRMPSPNFNPYPIEDDLHIPGTGHRRKFAPPSLDIGEIDCQLINVIDNGS